MAYSLVLLTNQKEISYFPAQAINSVIEKVKATITELNKNIKAEEITELNKDIKAEEITESISNSIEADKNILENRYLVLTTESRRFIGIIDLKADYGIRNMRTTMFYHHKGFKFADINYFNARYGFVYTETQLDQVKRIIHLQKELLYQHLLYIKRKEKIYANQSKNYQRMILEILEHHTNASIVKKIRMNDVINTPKDDETNIPNSTIVDNETDTPANTFADALISTSIDTSINKPVDTSTNKPTDTSTNKPIDTSTNKPIDTSTNKSIDTSTNKPTDTSANSSSNTITKIRIKKGKKVMKMQNTVSLIPNMINIGSKNPFKK